MKTWLIGALVMAMVATTLPSVSEAKRLGGGKSTGMQRDMPARTAPDAPPAKPATPAPQQATPANAAGATAGAAAAAPKRSWMGPLAGLAAGLGIAALMSHLGLGEAFGNFLMLALLAVAGFALVAFLMRRFASARNPALAGAGAGAAGSTAWRQDPPPVEPLQRGALPDAPTAPASGAGPQAGGDASPAASAAEPPAHASVARAFVPAAFDSEGFSRTAKMIFIRLQAANDTADLDDLRRFTTPELFAEIRMQLQERGASAQHTDVQRVDAEVLDVADDAGRQVVSVRFTGELVEDKGAAPTRFNEIWHLVKPHDDSRPWAIAGIEQMP